MIFVHVIRGTYLAVLCTQTTASATEQATTKQTEMSTKYLLLRIQEKSGIEVTGCSIYIHFYFGD